MNKAEDIYHRIIESYDEHNYLAEQEGIELIKQYVEQESRKVAIEFATQIDDTYEEGTPFEDRLKVWGNLFDKWKSKQEQP